LTCLQITIVILILIGLATSQYPQSNRNLHELESLSFVCLLKLDYICLRKNIKDLENFTTKLFSYRYTYQGRIVEN